MLHMVALGHIELLLKFPKLLKILNMFSLTKQHHANNKQDIIGPVESTIYVNTNRAKYCFMATTEDAWIIQSF